VSEAAFKLKPLEAPLYREPPHNIEAEQALLGAMLINNDAYHRVADFLKANHFFEPLHGWRRKRRPSSMQPITAEPFTTSRYAAS
jgi:hypothetical protein